jgi:hypothetical protein
VVCDFCHKFLSVEGYRFVEPKLVVSDGASCFLSAKDMMTQVYPCLWHISIAYSPTGHASVENANRQILRTLRALREENQLPSTGWADLVLETQRVINSIPDINSHSPQEKFTGLNRYNPIGVVTWKLSDFYDEERGLSQIQVDQEILLRRPTSQHKLARKYDGPFIIKKIDGSRLRIQHKYDLANTLEVHENQVINWTPSGNMNEDEMKIQSLFTENHAVEKIMGYRINQGKEELLIKYEAFSEPSWQSLKLMKGDIPKLVAKFMKKRNNQQN